MDFYVVLERAGYRVARRRRCCNKIGHQHKLTKEDAMAWFQRSFEVRFGCTPGDALPRWAVGLRLSLGDVRPLACWCSDFTVRIAGDYPQCVCITLLSGRPPLSRSFPDANLHLLPADKPHL